MKTLAVLVFVVLGSLFGAYSANATSFGKDETVHYIQDVNVTGGNNEPLFLGYKTTIVQVLAGLYITDDGYVFGLRSDHSKYIETSAEEIAKFQKSGLLPDPLPPYKLSALDYISGYLFWIVLFIVGLFTLIGKVRKRRKIPTSSQTVEASQQ